MKSGAVLQLITGLGVGGAERVVMELSGAMFQNQQPVMVVSLSEEKAILGQYPGALFPVKSLDVRKGSFFSLCGALFSLIKLIRQENIRVIHAHMFHAMVFALLCKVFCGRSISVVFTSHSFAGFKGVRRTLIRLTRGLRSADVVFSRVQHPDLNADKTFVIPNGVKVPPLQERKSVNHKRIFLFVGRLEEPKDPLALIEAFSRVETTDNELWIAGDGSLREAMKSRILELGLTDRVKLLGLRKDVAELFGKVDCFVMSSRWEGLPMALLEAGSVALPVISTPVGAVPELLGEDRGFLTNSTDLECALNKVSSDWDAAFLRGSFLRKKIIEEFNFDLALSRHLNLYDEISTR